MSTGRGRGYTGRHHLRETRPGDEVPATILSPRATVDPKPDYKQEKEPMKPSEEMEKEAQASEKQDPMYNLSAEDEKVLKELLYVDEKFVPLLTLLQQFSPGEDGIQFNRKLRHFETTVTNMCPDENSLQQAFATFRAAALVSSVCARKLAAVGASFTRQQRQQLLRGALLNVVMQGTFSKLDVLERSNPTFLINAANLMGDYFAEARLCNGNKVHIVAGPLVQYMRALLACDDMRAHKSLATQLMQNGRELLSVLPQEIDELSISIRLRLLTPPPVTIIWLLLSADLCLNKFLPLPNILQQFYASHLELTTDETYSEVSYGSWKKSPEKDDSINSDPEAKISQNVSQISLTDDETKPKLRPILGAGAGLLRQEQTLSVGQDNFDTWKNKTSLSKRYDLNSWRQAEEEQKDEEPTFNPTVLPPNIQQSNVPQANIQQANMQQTNIQQNYPITVPDYPPPNVKYNYQENFYLQQGDGTYIQSNYTNNQTFTPQQDFPQYQNEKYQNQEKFQNDRPQFQNDKQYQNADRPTGYQNDNYNQTERQNDRPQNEYQNDRPERLANDPQKNRRPIENWRKEKGDSKDDPVRNKPKNWARQLSKDNVNSEDERDKLSDKFNDKSEKLKDDKSSDKFRRNSRDMTRDRGGNRMNRRDSAENSEGGKTGKTPPRRHVSDVPRNHKYWDHDDRCDKDYNS